jgi:hypothetical protein
MTFITKETAKSFKGASGLGDKLANLPEPRQSESICCWSDLLGFSSPLAQANWLPDSATWNRITDRIVNAHLQCYNNLDPLTEFVLTLNDGIVRCCDRERFHHLDVLSMWLRSCIWTHNAICESEHANGLPGARTVLAAGLTLKYSYANYHLDDFVYHYTKPKGQTLSNVAQRTGNPVVATNPGPLQMNLAFSRAYILDRGGSRVGVAGPHFYIDQSVLSLIESLASQLEVPHAIVKEEQTDHRLFLVPKTADSSHVYLGFELSTPQIDIDFDNLKTTVWRLLNFYPCDEAVADFKNPVA